MAIPRVARRDWVMNARRWVETPYPITPSSIVGRTGASLAISASPRCGVFGMETLIHHGGSTPSDERDKYL